MQDYSVTLQDNEGRIVTIYINGDAIAESVAHGMHIQEATEQRESSAAWREFDAGTISQECWEISRTFDPRNP